ncbi:MAG TPA: GNAT family N-acetyltransferase [Streptosporangiaceae bacterium]|nr:GNAT family N-acetyltransferase [Streptosporangiaceae bacterium]
MSDESRPASRVRPAARADGPVICRLIRELAAYENALDQVELTEAGLDAALFGPEPAVFAHVAEYRGVVAGVALWFVNFSTWTGRHGIHLEDLFVSPAVRGAGLGRALLAELAGICVDRGYGRLEWVVLDWNAPALGFYAALGAENVNDWRVNRLTGAALSALAASRA